MEVNTSNDMIIGFVVIYGVLFVYLVGLDVRWLKVRKALNSMRTRAEVVHHQG